jgi:hypothetical protein
MDQQLQWQHDALATYCFRNLVYRLDSVLEYVRDGDDGIFSTRLGKPRLSVIQSVIPLEAATVEGSEDV